MKHYRDVTSMDAARRSYGNGNPRRGENRRGDEIESPIDEFFKKALRYFEAMSIIAILVSIFRKDEKKN